MTCRNNGSAATEWETHYSNPEWEGEWEDEWENHEYYSDSELEDEWENHEYYNDPELEDEWESPATHVRQFGSSEWEDEDERDPFLSGLGDVLGKAAKTLAPLAKAVAPKAAQALASMIPGAGVVAGPLAGKLVSALVREGELEAMQAEAHFFGANELEAQVPNTLAAHEAALTEVLAAEAAKARSTPQAAAMAGATVPMAMNSMRAGPTVISIFPTLVDANTKLVQFLRSSPQTQKLVPMTATIMRHTLASLRAARQRGQPITPELAIRLMAEHVKRVMGDQAARVLTRNAAVRGATAGPAR